MALMLQKWFVASAVMLLPSAANAAITFCAGSSPTYPCASVDSLVEQYQSTAGATAPNLSNGAYVIITPAATPALQGPFNDIVMGNDWNTYGIDVSGNWWKWTSSTLTWSNLNTTATPANIGLPTGTAPPPPPPSSLSAEWTLTQQSISGTTVPDASGNNNTATVVNGPLSFTVPGANFNGTSQYLQSAYAPTSSTLSVSVWFNATSLTGSNPRLISNSHTDVDDKGFQLMFNNGGASGSFDVGNGTAIGRASWSQQLVKGTWYHYVGVYDGSTVKAYINGVQGASTAFSGGSIAAGTGPNINVARSSYASDYFNGALHDVQICQCAFTAAKVLALYQAGP